MTCIEAVELPIEDPEMWTGIADRAVRQYRNRRRLVILRPSAHRACCVRCPLLGSWTAEK